jgi:hypothetical protein
MCLRQTNHSETASYSNTPEAAWEKSVIVPLNFFKVPGIPA